MIKGKRLKKQKFSPPLPRIQTFILKTFYDLSGDQEKNNNNFLAWFHLHRSPQRFSQVNCDVHQHFLGVKKSSEIVVWSVLRANFSHLGFASSAGLQYNLMHSCTTRSCQNDIIYLQDRRHIARSSAVLFLRDQLLSRLFLVAAQNRRQAVPEMIKERKCQEKQHTTTGNMQEASDMVHTSFEKYLNKRLLGKVGTLQGMKPMATIKPPF